MNDDEFSKRIIQGLEKSVDAIDDTDLALLRKARREAITHASINPIVNPTTAAQGEKQGGLPKSTKTPITKAPMYAIAASVTAVGLVTLLMLNPNSSNGNNSEGDNSEGNASFAIQNDDPEMLLELEFLDTIDMLAALSDIGEDINPNFEFSTELTGGNSDDLQVM